MGSSVSRPTGRTSFSVISAKARAALRWRSTLSENERVVRAVRGDPVKKLVVVRSGTPRSTRLLNILGHGRKTYSQDIEADLPRPPARSPEAKARMIATCANGLKHMFGDLIINQIDWKTHSMIHSSC